MICNYKTAIETVWYLLGWTNLVMTSLRALFVALFEGIFLVRTREVSAFLPLTTCDKVRLISLQALQLESFFTILLCTWHLILSIKVIVTVCVSNEFHKKKSSIVNFLLLHAILVPVYCINVIGLQDDVSLFLLDKIQPDIWNLPDLVIFIVLVTYLLSLLCTFCIRKQSVPVTSVVLCRWHRNSDHNSPVMSANGYYRKRNREGDYEQGGVTIEEIEFVEDRSGGNLQSGNETHGCLPISFHNESEPFDFGQNYDCDNASDTDGFSGLQNRDTESDTMQYVPVYGYKFY